MPRNSKVDTAGSLGPACPAERGSQLLELLLDLPEDLLGVLSVEADPAGLLSDPVSLEERRKRLRDSLENRGPLVLLLPLLVLDPLPVRDDLLRGRGRRLTENMRMPPDELLRYAPRHVVDREDSLPPSPSGRARPTSRLEHLIFRRVGQAIGDFGLIQPGDRILVGISGGKDSFALLHMLEIPNDQRREIVGKAG